MALAGKSKKILVYAGIVLVFCIGILVGVSLLFGEQITGFVIRKINDNLKTEVSVRKAEFSIFRRFPHAAVVFSDVTIKAPENFNANGIENNHLLRCRNIYVEINLLKLLWKNYTITRIVAENGEINLVTDKTGAQNFDILKKSDENGSAASTVHLYGIFLKNFRYNFTDLKHDIQLQGFAGKILLKGDISGDAYHLQVDLKATSHHVIVNKTEYLKNRDVDVSLALNRKGDIFRIETSHLDIEGIHFEFAMVFSTGEKPEMDMLAKATDVDLSGFQRLIPDEYQSYVRDFESRGKTSLVLSVKGPTGGNNFPHIDLNFQLKNGTIRQTKNNIRLTSVNFTGTYTNGASNNAVTSALRINSFSSFLEKGKITGNLAYENFKSPEIGLDLKTAIDLGNFRKFLSVDTIENLEGNLQAELSVRAGFTNASGFKRENIKSFRISGNALLKDAQLKLKNSNYLYREINSQIVLGNDFLFDYLSLRIDDNDFFIKGRLYDAVPYLLKRNNTLNLKAELRSQNLDLSRYFEKDPKKTAQTGKYDSKLLFPNDLMAELNVSISNFRLKKFHARNAIGRVNYKPGMYTLNSAVFETMNGKVSGNGAVLLDFNKNLVVRGQTSLKKIDIRQMFHVFDNFGQNILRDHHLKGSLTGDILVSCEWDNAMNLKKNTVLVESNIEIANGELINFEPLMGLSKFIALSELKDIRFSNLKNQIFIRHQQIIIPQMDINSSAFNISGSGVHDFDNHYTYRINVLLSEVLARKAKQNKKENSEFGVVEDDGLGKTKIPLLIVGFNSEYKISYDTKGLKQIIKESMQDQKKELRSIFREEFGMFRSDSTVHDSKPRKNTRFNMEWEEKPATETPVQEQPAKKKKKPTFEEQEGFKVEFE